MTLGLAPGVCIGRLIFNNILGRIGIIIYQSVNDLPNPGLDPALVALAVGSGAICFSHVTDSGFWIVKEYFGISVVDALKSYTLATCVASIIAICMTLALSTII